MGKHLSFFLAAAWIGLICTTVRAGAPTQNLLQNPSFENGSLENPDSWIRSAWAGQADAVIVQEGRRNSRCAKITSEGADAAWSQTVSIQKWGRYRLSGWVKTENIVPKGGQGVLLNVHGMDGAQTRALTGTNDWTRLQCEFDIAGINQIMINCLFGGWGQAAGRAWFDDISLELLQEKKPSSETITMSIQIDPSKPSEPISKYIYGQFIEHLGRCIYGGIWAEMLEDRKFYFAVPASGPVWRTTREQARVLADSPWKVIGPSNAVSMTSEAPLSGKHCPRISLANGQAGIFQEELAVLKGKEYTGRVVLRGSPSAAPIQVRLVWGSNSGEGQTVTISSITDSFQPYPFAFEAGADSENARLEIVGTGKGTFDIGAVSLMPADNVKGFRKDTLELLKKLNSPVYRWPGGNFVSGYDWRDGLGDRDRRPTRTNPAWTGIETNDVGIHEFVELCRLINAEPMIAVNTGFGDAYSAAAEVEYCNGSVNTPNGKWRAENGHPEPFGVKWWCVGNEMFGRWQLGYMSINHYVLKHNWVEEKMRQVDPTIKTIGVGEAGDWSEQMLRHCADHMNLISEHFYCQNRPDLTAHVRQIPDAIRNKCDAHRRYRRELPSLQGKDIRIAMDEWNYWYGPHVFGELGTRYFMKDALGIAAGLHEYFRNTDICFMANYAQTVNVIGCIKTTKTAAGFDATAYPLMLYRQEFGTIPVQVSGWNEKLDVAAALTEDTRFLTIGFVNATFDTYQVKVELQALKPAGKAQGWMIAHEDPLAYNDPGQPPVIDIQTLPAADWTGSLTLKPISITLYKIPVR
ncbi:MAG TPA: alpha-L-arabinofuranosidase C-terminal domain-containing protein [Anaerohalosphaeraceae bacterium]|nr:alpha-L-arabinofuranosidase C-terminal domain-containing protein [Anaerohalosphaeraceae bacterium]